MGEIDDVDNMDFDLPNVDDKSPFGMENQLNHSGTEKIQSNFGRMKVADESEFKGSIILYPAYFEAKPFKSGRKIPMSLAVKYDLRDDAIPLTAWHIASVCEVLHLEVLVEETKRYPRDYWSYGRVRVKFDKTTGHSHETYGHIKNKKQLIKLIAKLLPEIQRKHLELLRSQFAERSTSGASSAKSQPMNPFNFPISSESFPYYSDPKSNMAMKYKYGQA